MAMGAIAWTRNIMGTAALASALVLSGCGKKDEPAAPAEPGAAPAAPAPGKAAAPTGNARLSQPFADATMSEPPPEEDAVLPEITMTNKSVGKLYEQVVAAWDQVALVSADGKCAGPDAARSDRYVTLDDNVTQAAMRLMMRVDHALDFQDRTIHEASLYALDKLIEAQYPNGAWPQRFRGPRAPDIGRPLQASYPDSWPREWPNEDYRDRYTLNDNTLADVIDAYLEAARIYEEPRYLAAAERGGEFLIRAQMPAPQQGWAQQYDAEMHPAWARQFEPPSLTGSESRSVLLVLLALYNETGDQKFLEPVGPALEYYRRSVLPPDDDPPSRKARTCPGRTPCLARFYELRTNRPLYISKGTMVRVAGHGTFRDDGYEVTYSDESTITHYGMWASGAWIEDIAARYEAVRETGPTKRPAVLSGLSPWSGDAAEPRPTEAQVREILNSMDDRGAWVEPGTIGKADQVASVYAAEDMVVSIGDKTYQLKEDETLSVYRGTIPPREQVIRSSTFARNIERLAAYLKQ